MRYMHSSGLRTPVRATRRSSSRHGVTSVRTRNESAIDLLLGPYEAFGDP